jgi:hypothetical protein
MNKIDLCKTIQANVSKLTDNENLELFKIILDTNANYTKNNNGIFLNLNWIDEALLLKINNYISFCIKSQNEISKYELMKTLLNESINTKEPIITAEILSNGNNDGGGSGKRIEGCCDSGGIGEEGERVANNNSITSGTGGTGVDLNNANNDNNAINGATSNIVNQKQKFSSSMKFYLLKKKFMKQNTNYSNCLENDLTYEDYLIT